MRKKQNQKPSSSEETVHTNVFLPNTVWEEEVKIRGVGFVKQVGFKQWL